MAILEIELAPDEQTRLEKEAARAGITLQDWVRLRLFSATGMALPVPPPPGSENWTLQDALDYAGPLPEDLGTACALASQDALQKIWNSQEDEKAWHGI